MHVRQATIEEIVTVSDQVPELLHPHRQAEYERRLEKVPHLLLIAEINGKSAGFKVGYEREGYWYSWMGGVVPEFRRRGVAKALADAQEKWAKTAGYPHVTFKTRNSHRNMLIFGISNGFQIIGLERRERTEDHRILLKKLL